ncbi:putative cell surface A33 antigen-like [Scophthalmus maximus]|uniref:Putative cell surface A33 antigen-like n=1 Tax=Scophthalmus maximus TaxID=52904 RepID=A0A2U9BBQ1_SCOMX|nr:putative cell surface A33 antigen-like [Scophthalmus maximus]
MEGSACGVALLCAVLSSVGALQVNIPQEVYEVARGDNITLPCEFKTTNPTSKLVVISWSASNAVILTYYTAIGVDIKAMYEGRLSVDIDVPAGKAHLKLSSVTLADNKVFECRVQIPGDDEGKPADTARLVVLVAPSKPVCSIQGKAEYGQNVNLTCLSAEGSPPPTYKWDSRDVRNMPRVAAPRTTDKGGVLSLYNISKDSSGFYTCTSSNKIRSAACNITLKVMPPSMNFGSTAGIIGGVVLLLIILIIVIFCCCRHRKKKKEEEYAMGVRGEEFHDKEPSQNGESRQADGQEDPPGDRSDRHEERSERGYDDRRSDYDDRRSDYDDRRSDYHDRRSNYDDRRSDVDVTAAVDDRRDRYSDRNERYDDERRYNDRRDRRNDDDDRYDEPYDDRDRDRPPVPSNKPPRRDYDE